jgi:WD40 repeat protein
MIATLGDKQLASIESESIVWLGPSRSSSISPHGRYIAREPIFPPERLITIYDATGNLVSTLEGETMHVGRWSPDDSSVLIFGSEAGLRLLDVASGDVRDFDVPRGDTQWAPDGSYLLQVHRDQAAGPGYQISIVDRVSGEATEVRAEYWGAARSGPISPDGRYLTYRDGGAASSRPWSVVAVDRITAQSCRIEPVEPYAIKMGTQGGPNIHWAPDSKRLIVTDESGAIRGGGYTRVDVVDVAACENTTVATGVVGFEWSPDGAAIALGVLNDLQSTFPTTNEARLHIWNSETGLVDTSVAGARPRWSPDGSMIVANDGSEFLRLVDASTFITTDIKLEAWLLQGLWSPSGRYMAFIGHPVDGVGRVYLLDVRTAKLTTLLDLSDPQSRRNVHIHAWGD